MKYIGFTQSGSILIEMSTDEWQSVGTLMSDVNLLAQQVLSFRALNSMSQERFAQRAGISRNYLSMLESGKEPNLSLDVVTRIREAIDQP